MSRTRKSPEMKVVNCYAYPKRWIVELLTKEVCAEIGTKAIVKFALKTKMDIEKNIQYTPKIIKKNASNPLADEANRVVNCYTYPKRWMVDLLTKEVCGEIATKAIEKEALKK